MHAKELWFSLVTVAGSPGELLVAAAVLAPAPALVTVALAPPAAGQVQPLPLAGTGCRVEHVVALVVVEDHLLAALLHLAVQLGGVLVGLLHQPGAGRAGALVQGAVAGVGGRVGQRQRVRAQLAHSRGYGEAGGQEQAHTRPTLCSIHLYFFPRITTTAWLV